MIPRFASKVSALPLITSVKARLTVHTLTG